MGALAHDAYDGDVSNNLVIDATAVNMEVTGDYSVTYTVDDAAGNAATPVVRTVTVRDPTAPVITLTGDAAVTLDASNATYTELEATATDNYDASVTVIIGGDTVNSTVVGTYTVTYNSTDAAGKQAT